jgi:hypothetical protein
MEGEVVAFRESVSEDSPVSDTLSDVPEHE